MPAAAETPGTNNPRLIVTDALGRRIVPIDKEVFSIGRRTESDLRLPGADISRLHAEIVRTGDACVLHDRQSTFGTFVNDEKIDARPLAPGDRVRLGQSADVEIVFAMGDDAPSAEKSAANAAIELRQMAALLDGLRALGTGRVLDEVLALVLDSAIEVTGAERGFIMLANPQGALEFTMARSRGKITLSGRSFDTSRRIPEQVFASGKVAIVEDLLDNDMAPLHAGTVALGIRHVLCTPLRVVRYVERAMDKPAEQAIGVLYLDSRERGALVSPSARSALEMLSAEAALAIENARLYRQALDKAKYEQELKVAAAIQRGLLPEPNVNGSFFTASASSEPCLAVGGDFFDYVDLADGRFGFIVGDVAGKGSPAALLASAVTGMFGAESTYQVSPAALISRLNHGLFRRSIENRFLTAFYGVLGPDGSFTFTNGGHNAPFLVSTSGVRRLETGGMVLGLFEQSRFEEETITLTPGDLIIAFSDGVTEALSATGEEYMDDRLLASIERHRPVAAASAPEFLEHLLADVRTFCKGEDPHDDITLLMVRYDGTMTAQPVMAKTRGI